MLSVEDIAKRGNVSVTSVYKWIRRGMIRGKRVKGIDGKMRYVFDEAAIDEFLEARKLCGVARTDQPTVVKAEDCYPFNLIRAVLDYRDSDFDIWSINVRAFQNAISKLSDRDQKILEMRFRDHATFDEIGDTFGVTRERIRQLQYKAFRKLYLAITFGYCEMVPKRELQLADSKIHEMQRQIELLSGNTDQILKEIKQTRMKENGLPLDFMNLSVRTYNCMRRAGFNTLDDLIRFDMAQKTLTQEEMEQMDYQYSSWLNIRNLGTKCFEELQKRVYELAGYSIGG